MKNKVTTCGYFVKRLRDNGYTVNRIFSKYNADDPRRWTIMINPETDSLYITCFTNIGWYGDLMFEFNDGGQNFKNFQLKTDSMEVIISKLTEKNNLPNEKKTK